MSHSKVRLYVKSAQTVTGTDELEARTQIEGRGVSSLSRGPSYSYVTHEPKREWMLPEDQQKTVETIERIARAYGLEVEVLDVARENVLRRILQSERERIKTFPTLVAGSEQRLQGEITEEQVKSLFSKIAEKTQKNYV